MLQWKIISIEIIALEGRNGIGDQLVQIINGIIGEMRFIKGTGPNDALDGYHNGGPSIMTMRVINNPELIYEFKFFNWTCCGGGGGFAYERQQVNENGDPIGSPLTIGQVDTVTLSFSPDAIPEGTIWRI